MQNIEKGMCLDGAEGLGKEQKWSIREMLSCDCDGDSEIFWDAPRDIERFRKGHTCAACGCKLKNKPGYEIPHYSYSDWKDEDRKVYEQRQWWTRLCEPCGDFYLSLIDLGFCLVSLDTMREDYAEYVEVTKQKRLAEEHGYQVAYETYWASWYLAKDPKPFKPISL